MKIDRVNLFPVQVRRETGLVSRHAIVRLESDGGVVGWGEMSDFGHLPAFVPDLDDLTETLGRVLVGRDPRQLNARAAELLAWFPEARYYYDMGSVIRAGADIALHDLVARHHGIPLAELLGGPVRDRVPICYPIFRLTGVDQVEDNLARVRRRVGEGFDRFRLYVGRSLDADLAFLSAFTAEFGDRARVKAFDFSHLLPWKDAWRWTERLLEVVEPEMIESPAPQLDYEGLRSFRERVKLPVSEHGFSVRQVSDMLRHGSIDLLNICLTFIGGISPARELYALARCHHVGTLVGTTQELSIGTAAQAHLAAAMPHLTHPGDPTGPALYQEDVVEHRVAYEAGCVVLPPGPGLGVEPSPELLKELASPLSSSASSPQQTLDRVLER